MPHTYHFEGRRSIPATAEALWPMVADTDRFNRALGAPEAHYQAAARTGGGTTTIAEYRLGPLPLLRWTEAPFEWAAPRFYDVERNYHWGPFASFRGGMELIPESTGNTTVRFWADLVPRGPLGWLLVRVMGPFAVGRGLRQVERFERYLTGESHSPYPTLQRGDPDEDVFAPGDGHRVHAPWDKLTQIAGGSPELVDRLRRHLEHSPDSDVLNMRPLALADAWRTDRLDVLSLFLHAAHAGLLVLHWDVLCPHCRVAKVRYGSLGELQPGAFCPSCATAYESDFDRNVEVRFDVARAVRRARANTYCEAGPMNTPHRLARRTVAPNGVAALDGDLLPGRYRLVSRQSTGNVVLDAGPQHGQSLSTRVVSLYANRMGPDLLGVQPGPVTLSLVNHLDARVTVDLEQAAWPDTIATAALVSTLGTFRDLFSTDVLAAGQQVAIGRLTFLMASIADPAPVYTSLGQGRGFKLVDAALRAGLSIIAAHHGAVNATLGETILATFSSSGRAVDAALALQHAVGALTTEPAVETARLMQIGVHEGPCLGAMLGDRLSYFGTTPSTTASLLSVARGGEILISAQVAADPSVAARLADAGLPISVASIALPGGVMEVHRVGPWQSSLPLRKSA